MNRYYLVGIPLFIAGIILMWYDLLHGNVRILLVAFIPMFYGNSTYFLLSIICIVTSVFLMMAGSAMEFAAVPGGLGQKNGYQPQQTVKKTKSGFGVLLIGPIPIIICSDKRTAVFLVISALVLVLVVLFIALFFYNLR